MSKSLRPRRTLTVERGQDPVPAGSSFLARDGVETESPILLVERGQQAGTSGSLPSATETAPPQLFKCTRYSLYIVGVTLAFSLSKAIYSYMGDSVVPTTLEFIFGGLFTIGMYWISLYEPVRPKRFKPFLHDPLTLWSAVGEAVLAYLSAGSIYCFVRLMRESWEPPDHPPFALMFFLSLGFDAVFASVSVTLYHTLLGIPILPLVFALTFIPCWSHQKGYFLLYSGAIGAFCTAWLLTSTVWMGVLLFDPQHAKFSRNRPGYLVVPGFLFFWCLLLLVLTYLLVGSL